MPGITAAAKAEEPTSVEQPFEVGQPTEVQRPSVAQEPAAAQTATEDVLVETPPAEIRPAIGDPEQAPAAEEAPLDDPGVDEYAAEPPADHEEPLLEEPALEEPALEEPVVEEPLLEEPLLEESLPDEPDPEELATEAAQPEAPVEPTLDDPVEALASDAPPKADLFTPPLDLQTPPATPRPMPKRRPVRPEAPARDLGDVVLSIQGLSKRFGETVAVEDLDLEVREGSFYGIVGPNGAGKTTTLSMITGLLRPDAGRVTVHGIDVWGDPVRAKRTIGVLPDTLRLFDRLTGAQLLYYSGTLRGLDNETVRARSADLVKAFGIEDAVDRLVTDYSAGMTKKIALAAAMIHSPRLLVLDEPFESVDPVSAANLNEILQKYVEAGGTVVLSSHGMDFIQRVCDHVAIIVAGRVLSAGTMDEVRGENTLEERFVELAGGRKAAEGMEWLHSFTD
ncbi:ATP-binding cassette domain-containing protein [Naasia aerilata]|uniref:ABC transporter domain-containing protein n=1 Tax=Naasia aerilata TaxID=1162966 RepID=A0ABM8G875_9MICO|nr:hypothetical protein GCM10025866_02980 [Naasia aerilata]